MSEKPRDIADLYFAPVVLELDSRLERFGAMSEEEFRLDIILETNREPKTSEQRRGLVLETLVRNTELHGWKVSWDARGLRISHDEHAVVLGLPPNMWDYLDS